MSDGARRKPVPSPAEIVRLALVVVFFAAAPTAGDIGSACQAENDLDPAKFFALKQAVDCERCNECQIATKACEQACNPGLVIDDFVPGCVPLEHDGEVCIGALDAASCADYASYTADEGSTIPTECDFCPPGAK